MTKKFKHKVLVFLLRLFKIKGILVFADMNANLTYFNINILNPTEFTTSLGFLSKGFFKIIERLEENLYSLSITNIGKDIKLEKVKKMFNFYRDRKNFNKKEKGL